MSELSDRENGFCTVCHVGYEAGYAGPCQEPLPPYDGTRTCPGRVTLDETVRMQRTRAVKVEAEVEQLREALREVRDRWAYPKLVEYVSRALDEEDASGEGPNPVGSREEEAPRRANVRGHGNQELRS